MKVLRLARGVGLGVLVLGGLLVAACRAGYLLVDVALSYVYRWRDRRVDRASDDDTVPVT